MITMNTEKNLCVVPFAAVKLDLILMVISMIAMLVGIVLYDMQCYLVGAGAMFFSIFAFWRNCKRWRTKNCKEVKK